jgi:hypothetical protein
MPESATKKRLVSKLNEANGKGTPDVSMSGSVRTVGRRQRRRSGGDGLINLLTSRRKRRPLATGTYTLRQPEGGRPEQQQQGHSFRRQISLQPEMSTPGVALCAHFLLFCWFTFMVMVCC